MKLFLEYTNCKIIEYTEELLFRSYICDGLKILSETIAKSNGGSYLSERYFDLINEFKEPKKEEDKEQQKKDLEHKADNIIAETIAKCGLKLISA